MQSTLSETPKNPLPATFSHEGISVEEGYKIKFNDAAIQMLIEFINPILKELERQEEAHIKSMELTESSTSSALSIAVQATADKLIDEGRIGKAQRLLRRLTFGGGKKVAEKIERRVKKDLPSIFQTIKILYKVDGKNVEFPVELILRPRDTAQSILHSLRERSRINPSLPKD